MCYDSVSNGLAPEILFYTQSAFERNQEKITKLKEKTPRIICITDSVADKLTDTSHPQGVFLLCSMEKILRPIQEYDGSKLIVLEHLQDPGNMGTIIRTGEALGLDGVAITCDCVDLFSPKVLRSTMGTLFDFPVYVCETGIQAAKELSDKGIVCYAAALRTRAVPITECDFSSPSAIFIGNEGNGLENGTIQACSTAVIVPMQGKAESLNAAVCATISMWEMVRKK